MRTITLGFLDIALLYASLLAMLDIRYPADFTFEYHVHLAPFLIIFALWLIVFYIAGLYDPRTFRNSAQFYTELFRSIIIAGIISVLFFYLIPFYGITPKTNLFIFIAIFSGLEAFGRWLFNDILGTKFHKRTLLVGDAEPSREIIEFMAAHPQLGYHLEEVIEPHQIDRIRQAIEEQHIDTIVISPEAYQVPEIIDAFYKALRKKITFYNFSSFYERLTGRVPLGAINQIWFLENLSEGSKRAYEIVKRSGDMVFGLIFGLASLVFYPFIILAMQIDSPGPVFYRQTRVGQLGKKFSIVKFRTMVPDAEAGTGAVWAVDNDPRVTRIGKFLRRTRLDEVPQFWTVFKGDLSLVGPRAERPEFHEKLKTAVPFYEERYLIKPGLSGWAQINYGYGATVQDAAQKLQYDLYYIKNRSVTLDIGIVLQTLRIALKQSGQ